ncbi:hypothetical protein GCM10020227_01320 [Streptomyces flavovirens]
MYRGLLPPSVRGRAAGRGRGAPAGAGSTAAHRSVPYAAADPLGSGRFRLPPVPAVLWHRVTKDAVALSAGEQRRVRPARPEPDRAPGRTTVVQPDQL